MFPWSGLSSSGSGSGGKSLGNSGEQAGATVASGAGTGNNGAVEAIDAGGPETAEAAPELPRGLSSLAAGKRLAAAANAKRVEARLEAIEQASPAAQRKQVLDNKENKRVSVSSQELRERVKALAQELATAKNDAKLAAEIGQELLKQDKAKSDELSSLRSTLEQQRDAIVAMESELNLLGKEHAQASEALVETRAECELLQNRNTQLGQKLEKANREALRSSGALAEFEAKLDTAVRERDQSMRKALELQTQLSQLKMRTPLPSTSTQRRSATGERSVTTGTPPSAVKRSGKGVNFRLCAVSDTEGGGAEEEEEEEEEEELLSHTPLQPSRLQEQLSTVRKENEESKRRIRALETALEKNNLERNQSARKLRSLERNLDEYHELVQAQSELASSYKDRLEAPDANGEEGDTLESLLLREELARLEKEATSSEVLAALREEDLEKTISRLMDLEERLYSGRGKMVMLRRRRKNRKMYATCDVGVETELEAPVPEEDAPDASAREEPRPAVERNGYSGPLLIKCEPKRRHLVSGGKWKARMVELRGPHLLCFRNEWDAKPSRVIPIDGTEVRMVRRPHRDQTLDDGRADTDFNLNIKSLQKKKSRLLNRSMSLSTMVIGSTQTQQQMFMDRSARVLHEFHVWHPRRPAVYLSAPTHDEMSKWCEQLQKHSTSVAVRPRRFAAGYLTLVDEQESSHHLKRYFAVLRSDGIHLYKHPRKHQSVKVILLDSDARVWKPEAQRKASLLLEDLGRTFCLTTREQSRSTFLADTDVDCDWWVSTVRAYGMGVVSWGSVHGIRDDEPFGCLNI